MRSQGGAHHAAQAATDVPTARQGSKQLSTVFNGMGKTVYCKLCIRWRQRRTAGAVSHAGAAGVALWAGRGEALVAGRAAPDVGPGRDQIMGWQMGFLVVPVILIPLGLVAVFLSLLEIQLAGVCQGVGVVCAHRAGGAGVGVGERGAKT